MFRFVSPMPSVRSLSSGYAPARPSPTGGSTRAHQGMDLPAPIGTPVVAPADGVVARVQTGRRNIPKGQPVSSSERTGNLVTLGHPDGWMTQHYHLSRVDVRPGQSVSAGQLLGLSGNSGPVTGPHLHFETWYQGSPQNPLLVTNLYDDADEATRIVPGAGGYVYREWPDGRIDVVESPTGAGVGRRFSPDSPQDQRTLLAIRDEIGPWDEAPLDEDAPQFVEATVPADPSDRPRLEVQRSTPVSPASDAPRRLPLLAALVRPSAPSLPALPSTPLLATFGLALLGTTVGLIVLDNFKR